MKKIIITRASEVAKEYEQSEMRDKRLKTRLKKISEKIIVAPDKNTTKQFPNVSEREGTYRFINNPNVTAEEILSGHYKETSRRVNEYKNILVLHDTTEMIFKGERKGLGPMKG